MTTKGIRVIDLMLIDLLHKANSIGYALELNSGYRYIVLCLEAVENGEKLEFHEKREVRDNLIDLCKFLDVNYEYLLDKAYKQVNPDQK